MMEDYINVDLNSYESICMSYNARQLIDEINMTPESRQT